jgi:hypothetical protein
MVSRRAYAKFGLNRLEKESDMPTSTRITPLAIEVFKKMRALEREAGCTCEPIRWNKLQARMVCPACAAWWRLHSVLFDELKPPLSSVVSSE